MPSLALETGQGQWAILKKYSAIFLKNFTVLRCQTENFLLALERY